MIYKKALFFILTLFLFFLDLNANESRAEISNPKRRKLSPEHQFLYRSWLHAISLGLFDSSNKNQRIHTRISNHQLNQKLQGRWPEKNFDCSGLIRYLHWEAFQNHDDRWQHNFGNRFTWSLASLPQRTKPALFSSKQSSFVSARELMQLNSHFLGKNLTSLRLKEGDLLFFKVTTSQYHSMLVVENPYDRSFFVIYHTAAPVNELRIVALADLFEHGNSLWHPSPANPQFLGFFRFYFLD